MKTNRMSSKPVGRYGWRVRALAWVVFATLTAVALSFGIPHVAPAQSSSVVALASSPSGASTPPSVSSVHVIGPARSSSTQCTPAPIYLSPASTNGDVASIKKGSALPAYYTTCSSQALINNLLPINRWNASASSLSLGGTSMSVSGVAQGLGNDGLNTVAEMFFSIAAFLWTLIYDVMQFALTHEMLSGASKVINTGFASLANAIGASSLVYLLIFFVLFSIGMSLLKTGNRARVSASLLALIAPLATLQVLTTLANQTVTTAGATIAVGSPAWIAGQGLWLADSLSSGFATAVANNTPTLGSQAASDSGSPTCQAYVETLYADFHSANDAVYANTTNTAGLGPQGYATLATISALWEAGFLNNWMVAEFSDPQNAQRLYCHYLDAVSVTPHEQQQINIQAYGASIKSASQLPLLVIDPSTAGSHQNQAAVLYGWAACHYVGSGQWQLWPSWYALGQADHGWGPGHGNPGFIAGASSSNQCADWASVGNYIQGTSWGTSSMNGYDAFTFNTMGTLTSDYGKAPDQQGANAARNVVLSYNGSGAGARVLDGLISMVTAAAYAWALLGLGLGAIISQLGLIAMMIMLPGTLFLLALPRGKNSSGRSLGGKLLRLTAGFFASRFVVMMVLTVLVYLTLILSGILGVIQL